MLREKARPVNEVDAAILQSISEGNTAAFSLLQHHIPPSIISFIEALQQSKVENSENWRQLAEVLSAAGLMASALATFERLKAAEDDPIRRAVAYERMSDIERQLTMDWAAAADRRVANRLRGIRNPQGRMLELDSGELGVQAAHNDPEAYARLEASLPDSPLRHDPLRDPTLTKRVALDGLGDGTGPASDDCSFFVLDGNGRPVVQVEADAKGDRYLGCHESAIVLTRQDEAHPLLAQAEELAVRQLMTALEWSGLPCALFEGGQYFSVPPMMRDWIARLEAHPVPVTAAWIDLTLDADEIERGYRSAHRQSVRWGRKNLRIVKTTTPDPAMLDLYVRIHYASSRLPGLPVERLAMFLGEGRFNLYIAYFEDQPVVALLSSRHGRTTYYAASAKLKIGNKPLGHAVLHQAIMDAKEEGQLRFDFGRLQVVESFGAKERSIALYKSGFASHTEQYFQFVLRI